MQRHVPVLLISLPMAFLHCEAQNYMVAPISPARIETPVKIDGVPGEGAWQHAPLLNDFMQGGPVPGDEVSVKRKSGCFMTMIIYMWE
jgi:hypothetical protein